jgi:hypothetical protein
MDDSAHQEETVISNGTKGDENEEGTREDAEGYQPAELQVGDGDCCSPFMTNHFI